MSVSALFDLPNYEPTVQDLNDYISFREQYKGLVILSIQTNFSGIKSLTTNQEYDNEQLNDLYFTVMSQNFKKLT
jgi:hypothetical protein